MTTDDAVRVRRIIAKVKNARLDWALQSDETPDLIEDLAFVCDLLMAGTRISLKPPA